MGPLNLNMKLDKIWINLFRHVKKRSPEPVPLTIRKLGIDMNTWIYDHRENFISCVVAMAHQRNTYNPSVLLQKIKRQHERYLRHEIEPLYVFPGFPNPQRKDYKEEESKTLLLQKFYRSALIDQPRILRQTKWKNEGARYMQRGQIADPRLFRFLAEWMQSQGMQVMGAPMEVEWQLIALEQAGAIDAIVSKSGALAVAGAQHILMGYAYDLGVDTLMSRQFIRQRDVSNLDQARCDLDMAASILPEICTMLGTSKYFVRQHKTRTSEVLKVYVPQYVQALKAGKNFWVDVKGETSEYSRAFDLASAQYRHGLVLRGTEEDSDDSNTMPNATKYRLEPLYPIPEGELWSDVIGFDPIATLPVAPIDYGKACRFQEGTTFVREHNAMHPWFDELRPSHHKDVYVPEDHLVADKYDDGLDLVDKDDAVGDWSDADFVSPSWDHFIR